MALSESLYPKLAINGRWASGRELALQGCGAGLYFAAGKLGLALAFSHSFATPFGPAAGVALAVILLLGYGFWPGLLIGSLVLNLTIFISPGASWIAVLAASVCVAAGNVLAALAGAWLIETYAHGRDAFRQPHTILLFVALAAVGSTALSATSSVLAWGLAHLVGWRESGELWVSSWLADMVGVLLFTPLILAWTTEYKRRMTVQQMVETIALGTLLLLSCSITFVGWGGFQRRVVASSFLVIPIVLWTAFRFGQRGTTIVTFVICCFATVGTLQGHGPFAVANRDTSLLLLQDFIGVVGIMSLLLTADVDQRRRSDAGLRASENRYRELFENNPQPTWVFDYDSLRILAVNPAALHHYGYAKEEFLSMSLTELWLPEDRAMMLELLAQARAGTKVGTPCRHRRKDGTVIEVEVARNNLFFDGRTAGIALVMDVTERRRAERQAAAFSALGQSLSAASSPKQAARKILETAATLLACDGGRLDLCPTKSGGWQTLCRMDTVQGQRVIESNLASSPDEGMRRVLENGPQLLPGAGETGTIGPAGLSQMLVPVRKDDRIIGILSVRSRMPGVYTQMDLSTLQALADHCGAALDRLRTEGALRDSDERLKLALAASQMGIWTLELTDPVRVISGPELDGIFGLSIGEFDGSEKALFELIHPEDHVVVRQAIARAIKVEGDYEVEFRIFRRDRPLGWILARGRAYLDARGQPVRLSGVAIDITALKEAQQEVMRLNTELERRVGERTAQLEATNRELEAFSYSVSHDLRAPLRSVRGFCQVLLDRYAGQLDARGCEFLRRAAESSRHMDTLIEDLLQLSRISRAELRPQPVDLSALAETIASELFQAEPKRCVEFAITPRLQALGEERLLRVALENLLRNAWKFTARQPKARIEFGQSPGPPSAFFVRDNGAGFDMKYADRLFGVFQRLHSAAEFPGTGVGLATVQRILNRHGGRAWAEGVPEAGATFYFSLPPHESL